MPFARLTLTPMPAPEMAERLTHDLTDLIATDLGKRRDLTSVLLESPAATQWAIGAARQAVAAHLEVTVTAGTNSDAQMRAVVGGAMAVLRAEMPDLSQASYVVIRQVPGTDWGYDGMTQADRAAAG